MSTPTSPLSPPDSHNGTTSKVTRTVAIIKHHALEHRFDIEKRIQETRFEIIKERPMEFDTETDPEFFEELFGEDAASLAEGSVWVYVLERHRAVEVWKSLQTDLRALYSISKEQNAVMGSPDVDTAELQIASLFASSPPFPTSDLPEGSSRFNTLRSVNSSVLSELRRVTSDDGYPTSNVTSGGSGGRTTSNGTNKGPGFKARALPATHAAPDIVPRLTKAASLRLNGPIVKDGRYAKNAPRETVSKDVLAKAFVNVPGHRRAETIAVASTAAPTVAPRMTKAAALRMGIAVAPSAVRKPVAAAPKDTFEGVPGHKRRESIAVASVMAPTVAPRLNKSAALRASKDVAPPTSFMFRTPSSSTAPSLSRSSSVSSLNGVNASRPRLAVRPSSQASVARPPSRQPPIARTDSATPSAQKNGTLTPSATGANGAVKPKPRPSSFSTPSIAPRTNKSAALRAAKKAEEEAAAAAAAAKKARKPVVRRSMMV